MNLVIPTRGVGRSRGAEKVGRALGEESLGGENPRLGLDLPGPYEDCCPGGQAHVVRGAEQQWGVRR